MAKFIAVHPVIDVRDVDATSTWFCEQLGFELLFVDDSSDAGYVGVGRDGVELHLQWHSAQEWKSMSGSIYRFVVDDPDALFEEFASKGVMPAGKQVSETPWGTREFGLYDPDMNSLFFYKDI